MAFNLKAFTEEFQRTNWKDPGTWRAGPKIQLKRLMADAPSLIVACGLAMRRFDPQ